MTYIKLLFAVYLSLLFTDKIQAQSNPLYEYSGILNIHVKYLPSTVNNNVWTRILEAYPNQISQTWMAPWLSLSHTVEHQTLDCSENKKDKDKDLQKCNAAIHFITDEGKKFVSYKGNWFGCDSKETYIFHQHTLHDIYLWIAQQEDWMTNIAKPKDLSQKRFEQVYQPNSGPKNIFTFELNEHQELTYLKAEYITKGVNITWEFKGNKTVQL